MPPPYLTAYAGKASPHEGWPQGWHPLAYHALDVAAACEALLAARPGTARLLAGQSGLSDETTARLLVVIAAFHDIGKFADGWQAKLGLGLERSPAPFPERPEPHDHADCGPWFWNKVQPTLAGAPYDRLARWIEAAAGHHGTPVRDKAKGAHNISAQTQDDVRAFIADALAVLWPDGVLTNDEIDALEDARTEASWLVAGIVTLADWIGSNKTWFRYEPPDRLLADYWPLARQKAAAAIVEAGLIEAALRPATRAAAFLAPGDAPTPLQVWAQDVALPEGPVLALLEDLTGAGKTEAALILAHRLMAAGKASGLYIALPTQATANAMHKRLIAAAQVLFATPPSHVLVHGATDVAPMLEAMAVGAMEADYPGEAATASATAAEWIADERRKAFLAEIGVGTVDQALLGAMATRHQSVRIAALVNRVLIIDEAHAYDAYTRRLLASLLAFQGALGGSAIILSATLNASAKSQMLAAFAGDHSARAQVATAPDFPLASLWTRPAVMWPKAVKIDETPLLAARGARRDLPVRRHPDEASVIARLAEVAAAGLCVVWIRNTVQDVIDGVVLARAAGLAPEVFHARFTLADRAAIERGVLARFGKASTPAERSGRILIASQVVEQSLDIDFDVMVSDLAPLDLLIQRAGRLQRHERAARPAPVLELLAPDPDAVAGPEWYAAMFPRGAFVYGDHGRLHLTLRRLLADGLALASANPRALLDAIHGPEADLHPALQGASDAAWARSHAERASAANLALEVAKGYARSNVFADETRAKTRLGEETQTVRLARWDGAALTPWNNDSWRLSEIGLKAFRAAARVPDGDRALEAAIARVEASWGKRAQSALMVPLREGPDGWSAMVQGERVASRFVYDAVSGGRFL